jgi:chromosome condensin MukBEF complex kleisin-like MukF subunit
MAKQTKAQRLEVIIARLSEAVVLLDELASELEDSWGNVEGSNLENTAQNQRLNENADTLREITETLESARDDLQGVEL